MNWPRSKRVNALSINFRYQAAVNVGALFNESEQLGSHIGSMVPTSKPISPWGTYYYELLQFRALALISSDTHPRTVIVARGKTREQPWGAKYSAPHGEYKSTTQGEITFALEGTLVFRPTCPGWRYVH